MALYGLVVTVFVAGRKEGREGRRFGWRKTQGSG